MSLLKTLSCLILLAFFLGSLSAHKCVHDQMEITLKTVEDRHHNSHGFTKFASTEYRNIDIAFDFSNIATSSNVFQTYIKEILLPPVRTFWEATLKVPPRTSRLYVPDSMCGGLVDIPASAWDDGYSGDIVIFVAAVKDSQASYLAKSMPCGVDKTTNRPTIGLIIFNTHYINPDMKDITIESDISTTLHEITHVLGFSKLLYPLYINPDTRQTLTGHLFNKTVNGVPTMVLNLPPLTKRLRAHFNCSTLEGAYLENEGGSGSFGAHFERRIFYNEFMTASDMKDQRFSEFTLALLEGTGWYQVNYDHAEPMTFGKNRGCAFLDTKCVNPSTGLPNFPEFCSPLAGRQVSYTKRAFGYCGTPSTTYTSNTLISHFDYWGNGTVMVDSFADNCPTVMPVKDYDCEDSSGAQNALLGSYETYGVGAHAIAGRLSRTTAGIPTRSEGYCFKTYCEKNSQGDYSLKVAFNGRGNATCTAAGQVRADSFPFYNTMSGYLDCPDPNQFCEQIESEGFCKGGCFGNGVCHEKECYCMKGWGSFNCARRVLVDKCSRCTTDPLRTTCYGDMCVCNPSNITCQCLLGLKSGKVCGDNSTDNGSTNPNNNNNDIDYETPSSDNNNNSGSYPSIGFGTITFMILLILIVVGILSGFFSKKRQNQGAQINPLAQPIRYYDGYNQSQAVL